MKANRLKKPKTVPRVIGRKLGEEIIKEAFSRRPNPSIGEFEYLCMQIQEEKIILILFK